MTYDVFFAGAGAVVLGTLLGSWLTCRLTYSFQKRLLDQQLEFQRKQAESEAEFRRQLHEEWRVVFKEFRDLINSRGARLISEIAAMVTNSQPGSKQAPQRHPDDNESRNKPNA